ncbi:MAG TPA: 5'-3' exonuclease [Thermoleophilaceae bacterium]|nr:5'-3' exonuclease [Thermoleophilaceae bacterium]
MSERLLAVDAPYLLYRAFYALPDKITGTSGRPANALLGSVNSILQSAEDEKARVTVCCFGPDAAPYRTKLYPGYHAHRPPMPDDLAHQWKQAPDLYRALGWRVEEDPGLEADDLLGAFAHTEERARGEALILTGDRDLFQCATEAVTVLLLGGQGKKGPERVDPADVKRRYGVEPEQVPDFIALRGDPSDGLPGAKGIGEKRAADILRRHGSLEAALEAAERDGPERNSLAAQADQLRAFKDIATLREPEVKRPPDTPTDYAGGAAAARKLGMGRLADRLEKMAG